MPDEIAVCSVVKAELHYGAERESPGGFSPTSRGSGSQPVAPFDDECARCQRRSPFG